MTQEFLRPRLVGGRFDEHSVPLDILKDFSALEEMLIEVAKRQYLSAHPNRQRIPRGFNAGLELHLTSVEEGSAIPVIALVIGAKFLSADVVYVEQARAQIVDAIAAAEQGRQPALPPEFLRYFERFGRGLKADEAMEFSLEDGRTVSLTHATREKLVRASKAESWCGEGSLKGRIPKVDQSEHGFELELHNGTKLKAPLLEAYRKTVLEAAVGYHAGATVVIKGVIERDSANRPKRIELVENVTPCDPLDIEARLGELARLQDGWLDGRGRAPDRESLIRLTQLFDERFGADLPLPHLYPTPEGGVQAEWTLGRWEVSLEITLPSLAADYQAVHSATGETREQTLLLAMEDGSGWASLNEVLGQLQEAEA